MEHPADIDPPDEMEYMGVPTRAALAIDAVIERYPGALELFDWQCSHLSDRRDVYFDEAHNNTGASFLRAISIIEPKRRARWHAVRGVWVRTTIGVGSTPRRHPRTYERELGVVVLERRMPDGTDEWHVEVRCARCSCRIRPSEPCVLAGNREKEWLYCESCGNITRIARAVDLDDPAHPHWIGETIPAVPAREALKLTASSRASRYPGRTR